MRLLLLVAYLCATASALPFSSEGIVDLVDTQSGPDLDPGNPLNAETLNEQLRQAGAADATALSIQQSSAVDQVQVAKLAEKQLDMESEEGAKIQIAEQKLRDVKITAQTALDCAIQEAKKKKQEADDESVQKYRTEKKKIQEAESAEKVKYAQDQSENEHVAIRKWSQERANARAKELEEFKFAKDKLDDAVRDASRLRENELEDAKAEHARAKQDALNTKASEYTNANREASREKAVAVKEKADGLRDIREATGQAELDAAAAQAGSMELSPTAEKLSSRITSLLQTGVEPDVPATNDLSPLSSEAMEAEAAAISHQDQSALQDETAGIERHNAQAAQTKKEDEAGAEETRQLAAADAYQKQESAKVVSKATQDMKVAATNLKQKIQDISSVYANAKAIAEGTDAALKTKATEAKSKEYIEAMDERKKTQEEARAETLATFTSAEAAAKEKKDGVKGQKELDLERNEDDFRRAKKAAEKTEEEEVERAKEENAKVLVEAAKMKAQKFEELAAGGSVGRRLLSEPETTESDEALAEADDAATMTAAELVQQQDDEKAADAKAANDMVYESTKNTDDVIYAKKEGDIAKAETDAFNYAEETARAAKAEAVELETKDHQRADDEYLAATDVATTKYRNVAEEVDKQAGIDKVKATEAKDRAYEEATKSWEQAKEQARGVELEAFRKIEETEVELTATENENQDAKIKAAKADFAQKEAALVEERKEGYAKANDKHEKARARALAEKTKVQESMAQEQVSNDANRVPAIAAPPGSSVAETQAALAEAASVSPEAAAAAAAASNTPGSQDAVNSGITDPAPV
jgi:hypothetical protein